MSLLGDAVHNLSYVPTLVISWFALRWAERPANSEKTSGYPRAGILAAFTNALLLALVALYILYEAYERLRRPVAVREEYMIWISLAALAVNGGITLALVRGRRDLNLRSILIHNFGDALSNVAILAGALAIRLTGAVWVDPVIGGPSACWCCGRATASSKSPVTSCSKACRVRCCSKTWPGPSCASPACRRSTTFTSGRSAPTFMG